MLQRRFFQRIHQRQHRAIHQRGAQGGRPCGHDLEVHQRSGPGVARKAAQLQLQLTIRIDGDILALGHEPHLFLIPGWSRVGPSGQAVKVYQHRAPAVGVNFPFGHTVFDRNDRTRHQCSRKIGEVDVDHRLDGHVTAFKGSAKSHFAASWVF